MDGDESDESYEFEDEETPAIIEDIQDKNEEDEEELEEGEEEEGEEEEDEELEEPKIEHIQTNILPAKVNDISLTTDCLNMYEWTHLVGSRAEDISNGAAPMIDWKKLGLIDAMEIAEQELKQKKYPYKLRRPIGILKGGVMEFEDVDPNLLELPIKAIVLN